MSYKSDIQTIINNMSFDIDFSDIPKTILAFICFVDFLQDEKLISDKTGDNVFLSINRQKKIAHIVCGSYKKRI